MRMWLRGWLGVGGGWKKVSRGTEGESKILQTTAAWIPRAHSREMPSLDATVEALAAHDGKLVHRKPWLVAVAYSLELPYRRDRRRDLPVSALKWDMKALSHQHFFTTIGVALDPGNVVLSCMPTGLHLQRRRSSISWA